MSREFRTEVTDPVVIGAGMSRAVSRPAYTCNHQMREWEVRMRPGGEQAQTRVVGDWHSFSGTAYDAVSPCEGCGPNTR